MADQCITYIQSQYASLYEFFFCSQNNRSNLHLSFHDKYYLKLLKQSKNFQNSKRWKRVLLNKPILYIFYKWISCKHIFQLNISEFYPCMHYPRSYMSCDQKMKSAIVCVCVCAHLGAHLPRNSAVPAGNMSELALNQQTLISGIKCLDL